MLMVRTDSGWASMYPAAPSEPQSPVVFSGAGSISNNLLTAISKTWDTVPYDVSGTAGNAAYLYSRVGSRYLPVINTTGASSFSNTFLGANRLVEGPAIDTTNGTDFSYLFSECTALKTVPLYNTAKGTTFYAAFNSCSSLTTVPLLDLSSATNLSNMFYACTSLTSVPLFNTANATNMYMMFIMCGSLTSVPLFNTSKVTNFGGMFFACSKLTHIPALNMSAGTSFNAIFANSNAIERIEAYGFTRSFDVSNCNLSATALNEVFTNSGTPVAGQTISITNNPGAATCDRSIATAKGWAVTG